MENYLKIIKKSSIFNNFTEENILTLLKNIDAKILSFKKGENIFNINDDTKYFAILLEGNVHIQRVDYNGNLTILSNINPSNLFGEAFVYANIKKIPITANCIESSKALFIDKNTIENLIKVDVLLFRKFNENMLKVMAKKLVYLNKKVDILTKPSLQEKILVYLNSFATNDKNSYIEIPFNREELADFLCVNRSSLSRELSKMKKENIIDYHKNTFKLL